MKEEFLRLLLAQLQNQDPLNPLDAKDFTAQLATFSLVEQALKTNQVLESLALYQASSHNAQVLSLLGREVTIRGDGIRVEEGRATPVRFRLMGDAQQVRMILRNSTGDVVRRVDLGPRPQGEHGWTWDALDQEGLLVPDGLYTVEVAAKDITGAPVECELQREGRVEAVLFREGTAHLVVEGMEVELGDILEVKGP